MTKSDDTSTDGPIGTDTEAKPDKAETFATYRAESREIAAAEAVLEDLKAKHESTIAQVIRHFGAGPFLLGGRNGPRTFFRSRESGKGEAKKITFYTRTEEPEEGEEV